MNRRDFLQSSLIACVGASAATESAFAADSKTGGQQLYELRTYTLKESKKPLLDAYLSKAFIPALNRLGIGPVGVFTENVEPDKLAVHVLIVFNDAGQFATLASRLAGDAEHQKAGAEYLAAVAADPIYERIESSLLGAIEGMPKLEKPDTAKPRLLNLRIYESHNERAAAKKVEMFNKYELPIFRRVGLTPVFFGSALLGSKMPNLTYMLVFPDDAGRTAAWDKFRADEEWKKLKAMPEYADKEIVSRITNKILKPEPYSGI